MDRIESYVRGKLTNEEAAQIEMEMASDPELRRAIHLARMEFESLELIHENELREKMKQIDAHSERSVSISRVPGWVWVAGFACIAIVFLLISPPGSQTPVHQQVASDTTSGKTPEVAIRPDSVLPPLPKSEDPPSGPKEMVNYLQIAENEYTLPAFKNHLRSAPTGTGVNNELAKAIAALESGDVKLAIEILSESDSVSNPTSYEASQEVLAHAYFRSGQFRKASALFRALRNQAETPTMSDAFDWYLLLSLIPDFSQNKKEIESLYEHMAEPANYHSYRRKALSLGAQIFPEKK